jgi:hypothetical protein
VPGLTAAAEPACEPQYQPTALGWMIAQRTTRAAALARRLRTADDAPWAHEPRRAAS